MEASRLKINLLDHFEELSNIVQSISNAMQNILLYQLDNKFRKRKLKLDV